jgi:cell wall-associated NlpC family hydrolase
MKGIVFLSVAPMRKEPSDKAEMVNQILFGETFDILEKQEKWTKIKLHHDKYEGWIDNKQFTINNSRLTIHNSKKIIADLFIKRTNTILPLGSFVDFDVKENKKTLLQTAKLFLNTPYLWGGRTFAGIDCSGFTQVVFRVYSIKLLRDAYQQQTQGKKITLKNAETNDLAFFSNADGRVTHVGIVIKDKNSLKIIHASGKVRIDNLNEQGIFNEETQTYSHHLHSIKRITK